MKVLWHSNAPWANTGYGVQTGLFAPTIAKHHELAISAFYGLESARIKWDGIPVFPGNPGTFGNEYLLDHANSHFGGDVRGGLVVTLLDVWVMNPQLMAELNTASWVPVDHEPVPPAVVRYFEETNAVPLAMSRFGEQELQRFDPFYVPHGVDCQTYQPRDRKEIRDRVGIPEDAFVIGMVAANKGRPSRKAFSEALQAFRLLREDYDDVFLYLHTAMDPGLGEGEALREMIRALGLPLESLRYADQYSVSYDPVPPYAMSWIYGALDVLLNPAYGEGFGIPVLEAQACGVPAIVTNFSAMPEVCGAGWHVACRPFWSPQKSFQAQPDVADIYAALKDCYGMPKAKKAALSAQARQHALKYEKDHVWETYMKPALKGAMARFEDRKPIELAVAA